MYLVSRIAKEGFGHSIQHNTTILSCKIHTLVDWGAHSLTGGGEKADCALGNLSNFWQPLLGRLAGPGDEEDKDLAGRSSGTEGIGELG